MDRTFALASTVVLSLTLLSLPSTILGQPVFVEADGTTRPYDIFRNVLGGTSYEVPDCNHTSFGDHITQELDLVLNRWIFAFHLHVTPDDDRCLRFDRQRNEVKVHNPSPDYLKGFSGETVSLSWNFKLDAAFQPSTIWTHVSQIKFVDGNDSMPLLTLTPLKNATTGDVMTLIHSDDSNFNTTLMTVPLDQFLGNWVHVYHRLTYGWMGSTYMRVTRVDDSSVIFEYTGLDLEMWRSGTTYGRPKWGIYRSLNAVEELRDEVVLFDRFCLAKGETDDCEL